MDSRPLTFAFTASTCFIGALVFTFWIMSTAWFRYSLIEYYEKRDIDEAKIASLYEKIYRKASLKTTNSLKFLPRLSCEKRCEIAKKLGDYFFANAEPDKAVAFYNSLKELNPVAVEDYLNLYILEQNIDGLMRIIGSHKKLESRLPLAFLESPFWQYGSGIWSARNGEWEKSERIFDRLVDRFPYLNSFIQAKNLVKNKELPIGEFNIIGIWRFEEGQGDVARDVSGRWHHGRVHGARWGKGLMGKGLVFDGINDDIQITHDESLNLNDFTFCVWIKPAAISDAIIIINGKGRGYLSLGRKKDVAFGYHDGAHWRTLTAGLYYLNEWLFIAGTLNQGTLKLYQDGEPVAVSYNPPPASASDLKGLFIGRRYDGLLAFNGTMDEVALFKGALTDNEIKRYYEYSKREASLNAN